jgi:alanine racemase
MPVVKADAYGHCAEAVAPRLEKEGARCFAVAVVEEGVELRRAGVLSEILVMGWIGDGQFPELQRFGLVANIHTFSMLDDLASFARGRGITLPVHLKLDTGFTRLGFRGDDMGELIAKLRSAGPQLEIRGAFQNFASADSPDRSQVALQTRKFGAMLDGLRLAGFRPPVIHVSNSAGTLRPPDWPAGLPLPTRVRPGLILYSRFAGVSDAAFEDVMSFTTVVDQVKVVPAGTRVGYGGTFVTPRETMLAVLPVGYADGVPRSLSSRGSVLIQGTRCPIAGRVSMDLTAIDVTDLARRPLPGDPVVLFGKQGMQRLGVDEIAEVAGTVSWEVLCGVGPRVPRVIVEDGKPQRVVSRFYPDGETSFNGHS